DQPYELSIPYYNVYKPLDSTFIPDFYIVGGQCTDVIERLSANNIEFEILSKDTSIQLGQSKIADFETVKKPYEGHYLHSNVKEDASLSVVNFKKGDIVVLTNQKHKRFISSVLEPSSPDSYFAWNFFDSYLQQKEYFSPYVFEDKAIEILKNNPGIKIELEKKRIESEAFRNSTWNQLYFIYQRSKYYEPSHNVLPVYSGMFNAGE
ncbi:MAG: hypothetical protein ACPGVI_07325, partial [Crocinitomicaceae bacterium]